MATILFLKKSVAVMFDELKKQNQGIKKYGE